jgi:hypothetical protein
MRPDIAPGGTFPDYELPDHESVTRRLSELQGDDPLILTLARGHYCPKEHQQHLELAAHDPRIAVSYDGYWFWGRPSIYDLRADLREVTREIRPDFDLATPGLGEAWDAGDLAAFHGWSRQGRKPAAA